MRALDNLYGDTTFVPAPAVIEAVENCGADKILFGSDTPILGERCYAEVDTLRSTLIGHFGEEAADLVFHDNCVRLMPECRTAVK